MVNFTRECAYTSDKKMCRMSQKLKDLAPIGARNHKRACQILQEKVQNVAESNGKM